MDIARFAPNGSSTWLTILPPAALRSIGILYLLGSVAGMALAGDLFWSQNGGIWRGHVDGTGAQSVVPAFEVRDIAVSTSTLWWSDVEPRVPIVPTGVIRASQLDGMSRQDVAVNLPSPAGLAVDLAANMVYWSDLEQNAIFRQSLAGASVAEAILTDVQSVSLMHGLAVDPRGKKVYFGYVNPLIDSLFPGAIGRVNLDGSELETIVSGLSEPWGIAVDSEAGQVYWTDVLLGQGGLIRRANLDGANLEDLVEGLQEPRGIALDAQSAHIYWVDAGTNSIQRSQTTGLGMTKVFTGLDHPQALALSQLAVMPGDFNGDGALELDDIDALTTMVATGGYDLRMDLNQDGDVEPMDIGIWVRDLKRTWFGDSDLNGEFTSDDLVHVFQLGKYETAKDASWADGDGTGDRRFSSTDLVAAFQDGGFEAGPRPAAAVVPEPAATAELSLGMILAMMTARRRAGRR